MNKIAIVTDSTSDIPPELSRDLNIQVVPAIIVADGESYEDGKGLTREAFYDKLPEMTTPPTTATPSIMTFTRTYQTLIDQGFQHVISIHVAEKLSGIYSAAMTAANSLKNTVTVIDSKQLSMGLGFQVIAAAETAIAGLSLNSVLKKINETASRVHVLAMLDTLEYIHRSGRVSWARARLGSVLQIKPFLEIKDGEVINLGQVRTRRKGVQQLLHHLKSLGNIQDLAVLHTNAKTDAKNIAAEIIDNLDIDPIIVNVTTVIGTHVGPNGLGFAAISAE